MKSYGENIEDIRVVKRALRILPPKIESLVVTVEENKDLNKFTVHELQVSLINHQHRISRSNTSLECAFATHSTISLGRGRGLFNSRGSGTSFSRGGHNNSLGNVASRGQNQNSNEPCGKKFNK